MFSKHGTIEQRLIGAIRADVLEWQRETGETIADLAAAVNVNASTLAGYINGHSPLPLVVFVRLCRVMGGYRGTEEVLHLSGTTQDAECNMADLLDSVARADADSSRAREAILKAMGDGVIDKHELAGCEARIRDQHAAHRRLTIALRQYALGRRTPQRRAPSMLQAERRAQ